MPNKITSRAEYRFMQAVAHGMKPRAGKGPSTSVAKELLSTQSKAYKKLPERKKRKR